MPNGSRDSPPYSTLRSKQGDDMYAFWVVLNVNALRHINSAIIALIEVFYN